MNMYLGFRRCILRPWYENVGSYWIMDTLLWCTYLGPHKCILVALIWVWSAPIWYWGTPTSYWGRYTCLGCPKLVFVNLICLWGAPGQVHIFNHDTWYINMYFLTWYGFGVGNTNLLHMNMHLGQEYLFGVRICIGTPRCIFRPDTRLVPQYHIGVDTSSGCNNIYFTWNSLVLPLQIS